MGQSTAWVYPGMFMKSNFITFHDKITDFLDKGTAADFKQSF